MKVVSQSAAETLNFGRRLAKSLPAECVLALSGNLGSGKTQFVKGLALGLKIKKVILSPTFVLVREYPFRKAGSNATLYHLDLYRLKSLRQVRLLGLEELILGPRRILVIEWPEKIKKYLPSGTLHINFSHGQKKNQRVIRYSIPRQRRLRRRNK